MRLAALLAASLAAAAVSPRDGGEVRARAPGPGLSVPPPALSKPVVNEVLDSLDLGRSSAPPPPEHVRINPETARSARLFPEPPYLALSPDNIRALYDAWSFDVLEGDKVIYHAEDVGLLQADLEWSGQDVNGTFAALPGRSYRYRFTGRRGARSFEVESDPLLLSSFSRPEFSGATRLEVCAAVLFADGKANLAPTAQPYIEALAARLRASEPGPGGVYRLTFYARRRGGPLAKARADSLSAALTAALGANGAAARVLLRRAPLGEEFLAAELAPGAGPRFNVE